MSLQVIGTDTDRTATYHFLLVIHSNHGLRPTVSEINGDFGQKLPNNPNLCMQPPLGEFPLEFCDGG